MVLQIRAGGCSGYPALLEAVTVKKNTEKEGQRNAKTAACSCWSDDGLEDAMKNTTLTITFNTEKLDALTFHMGKRDSSLQRELDETMQRLYEKYVPQATREYIDDKVTRDAARERPRRPARPVPRNAEPGREENQ